MAWFEELPKRWEIVRAFALFDENAMGNSTLVSKTALQFRFGEIVRKNMLETDDNLRRYTLVNKDDIMINGLNLNYDFVTQRVAIVKEMGAITPAYISLRPRNIINSKYGCYLLKTMDAQKLINGMGTGIRLTLNYSEFKRTMLPLPPHDEQDQIVRFLDWKVSQINKLINAKRRQVELLREKRRVVINEAVRQNGSEIRLKYLAKLYPPCDTSGLTGESAVTFTPMECVRTGSLRIQEEKFKKYDTSYNLFQNNDILLAKVTPCFENSNIAIANNLVGDVGFGSSELFVLRCFAIDTNYLFYLLQSTAFINFGRSTMRGVAGLKRVNATEMMDYRIPLLSIAEQRTIVTYLAERCERIEKIIEKLNDEILLFSEYRTRLISDVVTGKVDVRNVIIPKYEAVEEVVDIDVTENENVATTEIEDVEVEAKIIAFPTGKTKPAAITDKQAKRAKVLKRLVLSAYILDNICEEPTAGRVKFEKLLYLSEHCAQLPLHSEFRRAAAGPYDSKSLYSIDSQLENNKWFKRQNVKGESRAYIRMDRSDGYKLYIESSLDTQQKSAIDKLIRLFKSAKTIQCEIVATLYGAWNDFLIKGMQPSNEEIVNEVLTKWHKSKESIDRDRWFVALNWMQEQDIVPTGYGVATNKENVSKE
jgi:type I restriction enzyme S subunit